MQGGLDALLSDNPQMFVVEALLWYPVEGHPEISTVPDVLITFGGPKGARGSSLQQREQEC